ncbi:hypothetical protein GIB67_009668 [Kingdonia uniflora]|uniref:Uncharacterized protein n=1 Tax=Kingdonia uniflora TaxID=39325 RepID=A0A7J7LAX6_9MAGN|nr:hypothetical protein GIB67_009668 [Kingdonia uniflora]
MFSLPPSPRWLLLRSIQGKASVQEYKEKAIQGLSKLRCRPSGDKVSQEHIEDTLISLKSAYAADDSEGSFWEVFQGPSLKAFTINGGLVLFQQSAGFAAASDVARVSVVIGIFKVPAEIKLKMQNRYMGEGRANLKRLETEDYGYSGNHK